MHFFTWGSVKAVVNCKHVSSWMSWHGLVTAGLMFASQSLDN